MANCEECGKLIGSKGSIKHGHRLCGKCKHKNSFPNIYAKLGLNNSNKIKWKSKPKYKKNKFFNLKWDERKLLWVKHVKETGDETKATQIMQNVLAAGKQSHEKVNESQQESESKVIKMPYE